MRWKSAFFNQISTVGWGGGMARCSRLRNAITAIVQAVHVGNMSVNGMNSTMNVGRNSQ